MGKALDSKYRPCVLGVITNDQGRVLVGERAEPPGAWQFPQGGLDAGETPEQGILREMAEEVGLRQLVIVKRTQTPIRYHFPATMTSDIARHFRGQDQIWFLLRLVAGEMPDLERASDREFTALAWVSPSDALARVVEFKRQAYIQGLKALGLLPEGG